MKLRKLPAGMSLLAFSGCFTSTPIDGAVDAGSRTDMTTRDEGPETSFSEVGVRDGGIRDVGVPEIGRDSAVRDAGDPFAEEFRELFVEACEAYERCFGADYGCEDYTAYVDELLEELRRLSPACRAAYFEYYRCLVEPVVEACEMSNPDACFDEVDEACEL